MSITARSVSGSSPTSLAGIVPAVGKRDVDLIGAMNDVAVGQDEPVGREDEPRPAAAHRLLRRRRGS